MQHATRIYVSAFLLDGAVMVAGAALPFYILDHLHGNATLTGSIGSAQSLVYAVCCLGSSLVVSRIQKPMLLAVVGALIYGGLYVLSPLAPNLLLFSAGIVLAATGMSLIWPALHSWLGAEPDIGIRTRRMGIFNISWSLGLAVGPLIGSNLYVLDYRLPFVAILAMCVAGAWLLLRVPSEGAHEPEPDVPSVAREERAALERLIHPAWVANAYAWALVGVTRMVFPKQMNDLVGAGGLRLFFESASPVWLMHDPARLNGVLAFILSFASSALFLLMGRTRWWHARFDVLVALQLAAGASAWIMGVTHSYVVMLLCFAVVGVNCGACFFAAAYYCTADPIKKHGRLAINEGAVGLGGFFAPFIFGYVADQYGIGVSFRFALPMAIALLAVQATMLARSRRTTA